MIRLTNTVVEGKIGTIRKVFPKRQRWPVLYSIVLDDWTGDLESVRELHLTIDEFCVVG